LVFPLKYNLINKFGHMNFFRKINSHGLTD
jgi:hypothetical protein